MADLLRTCCCKPPALPCADCGEKPTPRRLIVTLAGIGYCPDCYGGPDGVYWYDLPEDCSGQYTLEQSNPCEYEHDGPWAGGGEWRSAPCDPEPERGPAESPDDRIWMFAQISAGQIRLIVVLYRSGLTIQLATIFDGVHLVENPCEGGPIANGVACGDHVTAPFPQWHEAATGGTASIVAVN